ncbi:hypothetical protein RHMOL_Rhmol05G0267600 [Rhododendron molle]|uniref:Uncharacterized protein n=1 Tax=Rhododendron molle TaxID=49168 RepID=A0ACC0NUL7_RHOML|nr:hypothetical protein RHMOL_Rhmol05G0267600 [Rhododendron molle]
MNFRMFTPNYALSIACWCEENGVEPPKRFGNSWPGRPPPSQLATSKTSRLLQIPIAEQVAQDPAIPQHLQVGQQSTWPPSARLAAARAKEKIAHGLEPFVLQLLSVVGLYGRLVPTVVGKVGEGVLVGQLEDVVG